MKDELTELRNELELLKSDLLTTKTKLEESEKSLDVWRGISRTNDEQMAILKSKINAFKALAQAM